MRERREGRTNRPFWHATTRDGAKFGESTCLAGSGLEPLGEGRLRQNAAPALATGPSGLSQKPTAWCPRGNQTPGLAGAGTLPDQDLSRGRGELIGSREPGPTVASPSRGARRATRGFRTALIGTVGVVYTSLSGVKSYD